MNRARKVWVSGNWKMNHTAAETATVLSSLFNVVNAVPAGLDVALFPPMLSLAKAVETVAAGKWKLGIGSQNTHFESKGAFTGEVSATMLKEIGISLSLVGHSERRQYFGETDATAKKRTTALLAAGFTVIHCIGETKEEREAGRTFAVLKKQIEEGLPDAFSEKLVIAYEPVWAIGTGLTATPEQAEEAHKDVRKLLATKYGADVAEKISILYGGSVTPENFPALLALPNVDGGLVGGASLKPESFGSLVTTAVKALS